MSTDRERWARWDEKASTVVMCSDCTPESHIRTIRYLLAEAYEEGWRESRRNQWGLS